MAAAADNSATRFTLKLRDLNGSPTNGAWVQWVAAVPPLQLGLADQATASVRGAVERRQNGQRIGFAPALASQPTVVSSSQIGGSPQMACSVNNSPSGTTISIIEHTGAAAADAWLQWLAIARN